MDGSEHRRAGYYWDILEANLNYLSNFLYLYGLKYFVRVTRFSEFQYKNPFEFADIHAVPIELKKALDHPMHLYNYLIFGLKNEPNIQSKIIPFKN